MNKPPQLPEPAILLTVDLPMVKGGAVRRQPFYTADQMRDHADACAAAERERIAQHFDSRDKGAGGFYDPHEPAEIIRALGPV